ncbi:MAG: YqaA family protein [Nitrososphaerota archaeon]
MSSIVEEFLKLADAYFMPWGPFGLFIVAFIEAVFFPVPPDVVLIPLVLLDQKNGLFYGVLTTLSSVLGALVGYYVGLRGGRPVLKRLVGDKNMERVEAFYQKYGVLAVGLAAFTPIPFKVFTLTAGIFRLRDMRGYILASTAGRAARFIPESLLLMLYGRTILDYLVSQFELFTIIAAAIFIAGYVLYRYFSRRRVRVTRPPPQLLPP